MICKQLLLFGVFILSCSELVMAQNKVISAVPEGQANKIMLQLKQARPDMNFGDISVSPIPGLYQAQIVGGPVIYLTPDGEKFITGEIFTVKASGFAKYEDPVIVAERKKLLLAVNPKDSIIFPAKVKTKAVVYVFTDVDCGYCQKLNSQMYAYIEGGVKKPGYTDLGIEIRYLAYPRSGVPSASADKLITAWCSSDRQKTLTMLKENKSVASMTCSNPVAAQFELGGKIGVNGTPALWISSGELKPGYLSPDQLAKELGII